MQKLQAVNYLLSLLGSPPVGDLESLHPHVALAITRLDEAASTVQESGWWFNTEYKHVLVPDTTTGELELPSFVLEATVTSRLSVVKRGSKLYDTVNNTYQFLEPATVNYIVELDWDLLSETVQNTIKFFAGVQICEFDLEDALKANGQTKFYTMKLADMKKTNLRVQRRNSLNTPTSARMKAGVRPYRVAGAAVDPTYPGG